MADWLDTAFYAFDGCFFRVMNSLAQSSGWFFTPFFNFISFFANKGLCLIILSVILLLFKKSRKVGFCMLLAIGIGALFTNLLLKPWVARIRPYEKDVLYRHFWSFVGGNKESDLSFPSGHVTATASCMLALFLSANKRWSWVGLIFTALMCASRIYLIVHYATDVIGGLIVGIISGTISYFVVKWLNKLIEKYKEKPFSKFVIHADVLNIFRKNKKSE